MDNTSKARKQIKIFTYDNQDTLEERVNDFLSDPSINLVDIKELTPEDRFNDHWYKLLVIFTVDEAA